MFSWVGRLFKKERVISKNKFFNVIEKKIEVCDEIIHSKFLQIKDVNFKSQLYQYFPQEETLYEQKPELLVELFFPKMEMLKTYNTQFRSNQYNKNVAKIGTEVLIEFLEKEFKENFEKLERFLKNGKISYQFVWYLFQPGQYFVAKDRFGKGRIGSVVIDCGYIKQIFSSGFVVNGNVIGTDGKEFVKYVEKFKIPYFKGVMAIKDLPIFPVKKEDKIVQDLVERGKMFSKIALKHHFKNYNGLMFKQSYFFHSEYTANGRVMVDTGVFIKMNSNYKGVNRFNQNNYQNLGNTNYKKYQAKRFDTLNETEQYFIADAYVFGFSFRLKKWGEFAVSDLSDIKFNDTAFDSLVLEKKKKRLIKSFVLSNSKGELDLIQNKGCGSIFLLHGPPGSGKTLTAESIAEFVHRPLYSCSVGELGTKVKELEENLQKILEICHLWNAIILLDEADIFLEKRVDTAEIKRNAMIGVFLRLLEYHNGTLFLTTNRIRSFDKAFQSRISISIKYEKLDSDARKQVWYNLLSFFKFDYSDLNLDKLAEIELNGREIRNVIKLASTLSNTKNKETNQFKIFEKDINDCIELSAKFNIEGEDKIVE